MQRSILLLLTSLVALAACASPAPVERSGVTFSGGVAVAPVVVYGASFKSTQDRFDKNSFVGRIVFRGGFVLVQHTGAARVQSKEIVLTEVPELERLASDWLRDDVENALAQNKISFQVAPKTPVVVEAIPDYRAYEGEGTDSINLPREAYRIASAQYNGPARFLIIPVLLHAYEHTAGWFYDQRLGCHAGVRLGVLVAVYDREAGRAVATIWKSKKAEVGQQYTTGTSEYRRLLQQLRDEVRVDLSAWLAPQP